VFATLADLGGAWGRADPEAQHGLVGSMWPAGVCGKGEGFRAIPESEIIALIAPESHETQDGGALSSAAVLCGSPCRVS
jgi:hypothetical protein